MNADTSHHTTIRQDAPDSLRALLATDPTLLACVDFGAHPDEALRGLSLAPDGSDAILFIVGGEGQYAEASAQRWDVETGESPSSLWQNVPLSAVSASFSPDGRWIALPREGGGLTLWDRALDDEADELPFTDECQVVAFHPDGRRLVAATDDVRLVVWDLAQARVEREIAVRRSQILDVAFDRTGTLVLAATQEGFGVWGVDDGALRFEDREPGILYSLALTRDGSRVAAGNGDGRVTVWSLPALRREATLQGHADEVPAVAFSPDDALLASAGYDGTVRIWDVEAGREVASIDFGRLLDALGFYEEDDDSEDDEDSEDDDEPDAADSEAVVGQALGLGPAVMALAWDERGLLIATSDGAILRWGYARGQEAPPVAG